MLELIDLTYTYPKAKNAEALTDVSCRIGEGTWLLLGENGAGKTTLMRLAASLLRPTSGQVILDGENVTAHEASTLSRLFLLTDDMIFPAQTINEFASIHAPYYPTFSRELLEANLEEFGLTGKERIDRLSLGYPSAPRQPTLLHCVPRSRCSTSRLTASTSTRARNCAS